MSNDKLIDKLKKLINLREGAYAVGNEHEAQTAAAMITKLLIKYNIDEEDIPTSEKILNPIMEIKIPYKNEFCLGSWYNELLSLLCDYNMCKLLISRVNSNGRLKRDSFSIIGRKSNTEVVEYLSSYLSRKFYNIGKDKYKQDKNKYKELGITENKYLKSFLSGCVIGLYYKYKEEVNLSEITSLVVSNTRLINEFLSDRNIKKVKASTTSNINNDAYQSGIICGRTTEINKGIKM